MYEAESPLLLKLILHPRHYLSDEAWTVVSEEIQWSRSKKDLIFTYCANILPTPRSQETCEILVVETRIHLRFIEDYFRIRPSYEVEIRSQPLAELIPVDALHSEISHSVRDVTIRTERYRSIEVDLEIGSNPRFDWAASC